MVLFVFSSVSVRSTPYLKIMLGSVMVAPVTTFLEMSAHASGQSYYHNKTKLHYKFG